MSNAPRQGSTPESQLADASGGPPVSSDHSSLWGVAGAIAWRGIHTYVRRPDLAIRRSSSR